jgi:hypothetical protein
VIAKSIAARYGVDLTHAPYIEPQRIRDATVDASIHTDNEYDNLEYANILEIHSRHYVPGEISVHGSTADIMRNYFLLPQFYRPDPAGDVRLDQVVAKKFTPAVPARFFNGELGADWNGHMRAQVDALDLPGLPAYARLDNIYLRVRMQFWQGRISSSTNRIHPSFTPWTNHQVLETILATRWQDKKRAMLSRNILKLTGLGLDAFPLDGPGTAGIGLAAEARGLAPTFAYYGGKAWQRYSPWKSAPPANPMQAWVSKEIARDASVLEPYLSGDVLGTIAREASGLPFQVMARLATVQAAVKSTRPARTMAASAF